MSRVGGCFAVQMVRRMHRFVPGRSPEDGDEEYSDLGESASRGASEDNMESPVSARTLQQGCKELLKR